MEPDLTDRADLNCSLECILIANKNAIYINDKEHTIYQIKNTPYFNPHN